MASPFPGMDPYLEQYWRDVHAGLIIYARDQIQPELPGDLRARAGQRVLAVPPDRIPESHRTPYQVCVRRGWHRTSLEVYRVPLRERLPTIQIPLRESDRDVPLDLQPLIDQCYRNGGYDDDLDYKVPLDPPLAPDDASWADALLRS